VESYEGIYGVDETKEEKIIGDPLVIGWIIAVMDCTYGGEDWEDVGEE